MAKEGRSGASSTTPKNIVFGAGTIHKGLKYTDGKWNFAESLIGATSGGSKVSITPEITKVEVDGVYVNTKGLDVKTGGKAAMDINLIELTEDILKAATLGTSAAATTDTRFDLIEDKADIAAGDYWDNIAFVGKTMDGRNIIAILDNALCTSGFESDHKSKEGTVGTYTFECYAELDSDGETLPWHIYYPNSTYTTPAQTEANAAVVTQMPEAKTAEATA